MRLKFLFPAIVVLVSLVLCVRQLGEPDVWWQIRTGEFILEHGYVPDTDVFSYTYNGDPWFNVKWGTEVIMALVSRWFGPESLMLMHWLVLLGIMSLSFKSYQQLKILLKRPVESPKAGFYFGLLLFLMAMAFRINARPEMMSHLMTAAYLCLFLHYYNQPGRQIFLLIPLQLIWANLHEAYGVGQVLILIFLASIWYRHFFYPKRSKLNTKQIRLSTVAGVLALISVAVHPMGLAMLVQPFDIFNQLGENKFTTELWSFRQGEYWNLAAYLTLLLLVLISMRWLQKRSGQYRWQSLPLFYLVLTLSFIYLAASANRNLPFLLIVLTPVLTLDLEQWLGDAKPARIAYFTSGLLFYFYVASGNFYQRFYPVEKYGLKVDVQSTPVGAAQFIKTNGLQGNAYVDYFSSSYLLWALQPEFKSYLDLRDLDVFESQFISNNLLNYTQPSTPTKSGMPLFRFMEEIDHFTYVVMENNAKFLNFHRYMNALDDYVLAYADPLTSVYIKDNEQNSSRVQVYRKMSVEEKFKPYGIMKPAPFNKLLSQVMAPWYTPVPPDYRIGEYLSVYKTNYLN